MSFFNIDNPIKWFLLAHIFGGGLALLTFLIPLITKKGGKLHGKAGWVYVSSMLLVCVSSLVITPWRVFFDEQRVESSIIFSLFLFFITVFTITSLSNGMSVLKEKKRAYKSTKIKHIGMSLFLVILALVIQYIGLVKKNNLLFYFPFLAHVTAFGQLKYWLKAPAEKMHWWYFHMNQMFVACIATLTAFLVTALPRLVPSLGSQSILMWIAPGLILGTIANRWTAKYKKQFEN